MNVKKWLLFREGWSGGGEEGYGSTYPIHGLLGYIIETVMFRLILFVRREAQHPEIYADILVSDKTMIAWM